MKNTSWEIILAGFIFVGIAIYLAESYSSHSPESNTTASSINLDKDLNIQEIEGINLEQLKELENLSELEDLQKLESLKSLSSILPAEVQKEFETEINAVIKDLKQEKNPANVSASTLSNDENYELKGASGRWSVVSPGVYAFHQKFDASELKEVELELPFGSIEVIGSQESQASFSLKASGQIANKADLQSKIKTVSLIENEKGIFSITSAGNPYKDQNIQLQATLKIPARSALNAFTKAGHISSKNVHGEQQYQTLGGHIKLNNIEGNIKAKTSGGHISVNEASGSFDLLSLGGHIQVHSSEGNIVMKTSGGNLQANDITGSVQASTNGGNIELRFINLEGSSNAKTGAGIISIWVPKTINASFDLSGNTVEIDDVLKFIGEKSSGAAKGQIGSDGGSVQATTNYGQIILKANN